MKTSPRTQWRHTTHHLRKIWTFFAIMMLLASILPALARPVAAQADAAQPTDQPADVTEQPVENPTVPPVEQPTDIPADQGGQPTAPSDVQPLQDQPADLQELSTITIDYEACPPGTDLAAADATALAAACVVPGTGASFTLAGSAGVIASESGAAPISLSFVDVPAETVSVTQEPAPLEGLAIFCEGNTSYGNTKPYARMLTLAGTVSIDVLAGETIACDWYVMAPTTTGDSVTVYTWQCDPGTQYGSTDPDYYPTQCATEHLNIPISLIDGNGPHDTTTQANGTQWSGVVVDAQGKITIKETIPTGFGDPVVMCQTLDEMTGTLVPSTGGTVVLTPNPATGFTYQCNWYNVPSEGGNTVTIYKWKCDPGTIYGSTDPDYYPTQCATEMIGVDFTLTDANGTLPFKSDTNGKQLDGVMPGPTGTFTLTEMIPDGYGDPVVFCQNNGEDPQPNQPTLVISTGGIVTIQPSTAAFEYQCFWYNVPETPGTVTIYKWECPQGVTVDPTLQAHQSACTQPMNNVTFTLADSLGPRAMTTTGGMVQWTDVQIETFTVTEEVPAGYSVQPYVSCDFESQNNLPINYLVTNNVLTLTLNHSGQKITCQWFNQYMGPGEVTIYKWTCPEGYDVSAWGANPKNDCTEATNGINFVLDQPDPGVDLQTMTGDSISGAVYFGGLTPGDYVVTEQVPAGIAQVFVLDCVGLNTGSVHPVPLSVGPTLAMKIAGGDKIRCDWYNVPQLDPQYGWMTVTKYNCTTPTYVSDIDCEVFEGGKAFDLQMWNGTNWVGSATGTTNTAGQLTWTNLTPGTYRVVEQGATACKVTSTLADANGNPVVNANANTAVKVYDCGQVPPPGSKAPTKYPNTGVDPAASTRVAPSASLLGVLGLAGSVQLSRRTFLRRSLVSTAAVGAGALAVANGFASQVIQPIGTAVIEPEGSPEATPGPNCLYPATPSAATPPDGTPVACARGAVPVKIAIETIKVDADIEVLEIVGGEMQPPSGATDVAWYKESARLGEQGNILLAGHLNYWGVPEGVFFALGQLREGDTVELTGDDDDSYRYIVQWTQDFPSDEEPPEEALGQTTEQVITMITCGGEWVTDRAEYDHRTLVRAIRDSEYVPATPDATPGA